jgi:hypothetical protein
MKCHGVREMKSETARRSGDRRVPESADARGSSGNVEASSSHARDRWIAVQVLVTTVCATILPFRTSA